jgi:hypothetical protein
MKVNSSKLSGGFSLVPIDGYPLQAKRGQVSCVFMATAKVPVTESVTLDWIRSVLGVKAGGIRAERIGEAYGLSSKLYRCWIGGTGIPSSVVVKLSESERAADLREVPFYSTFATERALIAVDQSRVFRAVEGWKLLEPTLAEFE